MKRTMWLFGAYLIFLFVMLFAWHARAEAAECHKAVVINIVDGDTVDVQIPFFNMAFIDRVRLLGIDTPEMNEENGENAKNAVKTWLMAAGPVKFCTDYKRGKYGRWLGDFVARNQQGINVSLVAFLKQNGFDKPKPKKKSWWKF